MPVIGCGRRRRSPVLPAISSSVVVNQVDGVSSEVVDDAANFDDVVNAISCELFRRSFYPVLQRCKQGFLLASFQAVEQGQNLFEKILVCCKVCCGIFVDREKPCFSGVFRIGLNRVAPIQAVFI